MITHNPAQVCRALSERNWDLINSILKKLGRQVVIQVLSKTVDKEVSNEDGVVRAGSSSRPAYNC